MNNQLNHQQPQLNPQLRKLREGLEQGDLARLVHNELHVDEYKSKMGNDEDLVVVSFKVGGKDPATDLVNFIEKSYDWVIDADTSAGEMDDGDYIVFVELDRTPKAAEQILEILNDLKLLADNDVEGYRVRYHKGAKDHECNLESLRGMIPGTPQEYLQRVGKDNEALDKLKAQAGVKIDTKSPDNKYTESLKVAAGIL